MKKSNCFGKFLVGLGIGAGIGMLFAPKKGSELWEDLKKEFNDLVAKLKDVDREEVKKEFLNKVDEMRKELEDLDKEKVLKIAKSTSDDLKKKADELVNLAKEKGTPILEEASDNIRKKVIEAGKEAISKLESKDK